MKYAIISDIHGNVEALKNVLTHLESEEVSSIICLGDVVGYGPKPNECVELVKEHTDVCLMGNHDHAVLGLTDVNHFNQYARDAVLWTRRTMTQYNKSYLENMPFISTAGDAMFVHATPVQPKEWHYIFSAEDARRNLDAIKQKVAFIGHSHIPVIFSYNEGVMDEEDITLDLSKDRYIVNVGSIGQPRDGDPRSCFVIYDSDTTSLRYVRLEYPVETTYQQIIDSQLPSFLAMRLFAGQ
ncbi:MAG: metallophosphoesterase family protein [Calditrichia bacterium]